MVVASCSWITCRQQEIERLTIRLLNTAMVALRLWNIHVHSIIGNRWILQLVSWACIYKITEVKFVCITHCYWLWCYLYSNWLSPKYSIWVQVNNLLTVSTVNTNQGSKHLRHGYYTSSVTREFSVKIMMTRLSGILCCVFNMFYYR